MGPGLNHTPCVCRVRTLSQVSGRVPSLHVSCGHWSIGTLVLHFSPIKYQHQNCALPTCWLLFNQRGEG